MWQKNSDRKSRLYGLFYFSLSLLKAISIELREFVKFAAAGIFTEIFFALVTLGFAYIFASWGISANFSWFLAICTVLTLLVVLLAILIAIAFFSDFSSKSKKLKKSKVKLANWIAKTLRDRKSTEWSEYQDWLHDILLARRQLLDAKCPKWKVFAITYWRLSIFLIIVSFTRIKNTAVAIMKLR